MVDSTEVDIPFVFKPIARSHRIVLKRNRIDPPTLTFPRGMKSEEALHEIMLHPSYALLKAQMQRPVENAILDGYKTRLYTFKFFPNLAGKYSAYQQGDMMKIYLPPDAVVDSHAVQRFLFNVLKSVIKSESERIVPVFVEQRTKELGLEYKSVTIKPLANAWGKCSSDKRLFFSSALLLYPDNYVRLIIDHELAHLSHMNHSQAFWDLLSSYRGVDAQQEEREMNAYKLLIPSIY